MRFDIPRRIGVLIVIGLALLAASGAAGAIGDSLRQNYHADCTAGAHAEPLPREPGSGNETEPEPPTPEERAACREARLPVTIVDAIHRGTLAPGIAIVAIGGVYILGAAIAMLRRG